MCSSILDFSMSLFPEECNRFVFIWVEMLEFAVGSNSAPLDFWRTNSRSYDSYNLLIVYLWFCILTYSARWSS